MRGMPPKTPDSIPLRLECVYMVVPQAAPVARATRSADPHIYHWGQEDDLLNLHSRRNILGNCMVFVQFQRNSRGINIEWPNENCLT